MRAGDNGGETSRGSLESPLREGRATRQDAAHLRRRGRVSCGRMAHDSSTVGIPVISLDAFDEGLTGKSELDVADLAVFVVFGGQLEGLGLQPKVDVLGDQGDQG